MKRLHIVGCPRSGTTLMMELMATCFESDGHCGHEMSLFELPTGAPTLYFSKQPSDIRYLDFVLDRDPQLYVIFLVRDPRSVIASIHGSNRDQYFCNFRVWSECYNAGLRFQNHERFLSLRYEDLVSHPDKLQIDIEKKFQFLNRKCMFSEFHQISTPTEDAAQALNGLRAVSNDRVKGWTNHLPRIKEQLQRYPELGQVLFECGYEKDSGWLSVLEQAEPEVFPCRYTEKSSFFKKIETQIRKRLQARSYLSQRKKQGRL